jgi:hypothetical protein
MDNLTDMEKHQCSACPIRAKYDRNPRSLIGRFWRWHINFGPGWKKYYASLGGDEQEALRQKYSLKK